MRALIVGASRGIGAALAAEMTARGDTVLEANRADGFDVTAEGFEERLRALAGTDPLDLLVCNAGIFNDRSLPLDAYGTEMAESFAVNVEGPFRAVRALVPNLRAARGKVAVISSQLGSSEVRGGSGYAYRASKAAATNLALNLAAGLAPDIAVGAYHPGWVRTDMGGASAAISPEASAAGLLARFDALGPDHTGVFETWDGRAHPV